MSVSKSLQGVRLFDALGNAIKAVQDGADYLLGVAAKVRDVSGSIINPATEEILSDLHDTGNSTTSQLSADGVFTGTGISTLGYRAVSVAVYSDKDSAPDGLEVQVSIDGSFYTKYYYDSIDTLIAGGKTIQVPIVGPYLRVKYTNGDEATSNLTIQTYLHRIPPPRLLAAEATNWAHSAQSNVVGGIDEDRNVRWVRVDENDNLRVAAADNPEDPIFVTISSGKRSYYHNNLINIDEPARIDAGASEPYDVGGDTLTVSVNGGTAQTPTFSTRAAQPGIHYSAPYPRTSNPDHEKLKVSVDGGELLEVKIGKGLTTGDSIAAALQTQIRANVENGSSVTVEYNTAEYPYRYVFKSGTTGSSSSIHVEKGGDDLAKKVLFVGLPFGGTERIGLNADNYWAFEVVEFLTGELTDVQISTEDSGLYIKTVAQGSSSSLQVTTGGANTALQFPTTLVSGTTGSGDDDMGVDGSVTAVRYAVDPPSGRVFVVTKLRFFIRDDGIALNKFAGQDPLANGVKLEVRNENLGLIPVFVATTSADLMSQAEEPESAIYDNGWATGGQDLLKAVFDFSPGLSITEGTITNFVVSIQDDLSALDGTFYVRASGWVEGASE